MSENSDSSSDNNDIPATKLTPSLKECSKGISELISLLAAEIAVLR